MQKQQAIRWQPLLIRNFTFTDEELAASAKDTKTAVYVISRNAGEGADRGMTKKVTVK